jgi:GTP-binding protein
MIDLGSLGGVDGCVADHGVILREIEAFGRGLIHKPRLTVYSKADLVPDPDASARVLNERLGVSGYPVSAVTGLNVDRLLEDCWASLHPPGN